MNKRNCSIACIVFALFYHTILFGQSANKLPQLGKQSLKEVIAAMTVDEKINLVIGTGMKMAGLPKNMQGPVVGETMDKVAGAAGTTNAIARLGIPSIVVADGPAGLRIQPFRNGDTSQSFYCTAFPIATLLASSWDTDLVKKVGAAMGNETKEYGVDILLAPALNIHRNPLGGRNFEYYSEDPYLSGKITAAMVGGIQSQGVGTSVKHFAANNHEFNRNTMNVVVGERALREIYLRGFQLAIKEAKPWTVMSSYNRINGTYTSESHDLLTTVLRKEWGYNGMVMTDWFGGSDAVNQLKAGNDLLMPGTALQQTELQNAIREKLLDEKTLNLNVESILKTILLTPTFKKYKFNNKPNLKAHALLAAQAAAEGMVLLKNNDNTLPFSSQVKTIAVFGNASYNMVTGGTGSGDVNEAYTISLTQALTAGGYRFDENLKFIYENYIADKKATRRPPANPFLLPEPIAEMKLKEKEITKLATSTDLAVITIGRNSGEFADRKVDDDFNFSDTEMDLIKDVSEAFHQQNKKVVVILNIGGVVETDRWKDKADAILLAWQPGQEAGNAITKILKGTVNPSGKLTSTFPIAYNDVPSAKNFPGKVLVEGDGSNTLMGGAKAAEVVYEEGIYVGYRYFAQHYGTGQAPVYPFGYGLSYTQFAYSPLRVSSKKFTNKISVSVEITNTGNRAGKEVVQLYLQAPGKQITVPLLELKAFGKTALLAPGKKQTLTFIIDAQSIASFDVGRESWVAEPGHYIIKVGASSADIKQRATFTLANERVVEKVNKALSPQVPI